MSMNKRHQAALKEIKKLKKQQTRAILKMAIVTLLTAIVVVVFELLVLNGTIDMDYMTSNVIMMILIFLMAAYDGSVTKSYTAPRNEIQRIQKKNGLTDADVKEMLKR